MTTATYKELSPADLWPAIRTAGGISRWIEASLRDQDLWVDRIDAANLGQKELADYKKRLKAEAAELKVLRRAAWEAYRAHHIVHLGESIYWNDEADADRFDLPNGPERLAENELPELKSPEALAKALDTDIPGLRWLTYHRDAAEFVHYSPFTIPKKKGGLRQIWAPMPKMKAAQRWILRHVLEPLPVHGAAHGFLPGRSILTNARAHGGSKIVVNMDIKDFFPTITLPRVKGLFRTAGYQEQVATLLALLCTEAPRRIVDYEDKTYYLALGPRCLPQGAPTSPAITNIICLRLDRRLTGLAKALGWRYTRYADDLTFSLPEGHKDKPRIGHLLSTVRAVIEDEGFEVHPDKTRVARSGARQKVTGLVVNGDDDPRVPRHRRRMVRAAIHNLKAGKELHDGESVHTIAGWAAFIFMTDPELGAKYLEEIAPFVAREA